MVSHLLGFMSFGIFVGYANCFNCLDETLDLEYILSSWLYQSMERLLMYYLWQFYPGFCSYAKSSQLGFLDVYVVSSMCLSDFRWATLERLNLWLFSTLWLGLIVQGLRRHLKVLVRARWVCYGKVNLMNYGVRL